eukprot:1980002-Alexandrium_andersonii.AAC.1
MTLGREAGSAPALCRDDGLRIVLLLWHLQHHALRLVAGVDGEEGGGRPRARDLGGGLIAAPPFRRGATALPLGA